jgi:hypothetical protein
MEVLRLPLAYDYNVNILATHMGSGFPQTCECIYLALLTLIVLMFELVYFASREGSECMINLDL